MSVGGYTKAGYTSVGYTTDDYLSYWSEANLQFWRPRIKLYSKDGSLLHDYNPWSSSNDIIFEKASVEHSLNSPGSFECIINDRGRDIDRSKIGNANKVVISHSNNGNEFHNIISGRCKLFKPMRDTKDGLKYGMIGYGTGILTNDWLVDIKMAATRKVFGKAAPDPNDPRMKVYALAKRILETTDFLVSPEISLAEYAGLDLSGIDNEVQENLMTFEVRNQPISTAWNHLVDRAGLISRWNPYDKVILTYPEKYVSPVTFKTFDPNYKDQDRITDTSYFRGNWDIEIPTDSDTFANCLIAVSGAEPLEGVKQTDTGEGDNGAPCHDRENCQEIICDIPDLSFISVLLRKIGTIAENVVKGIIWNSVGNKPFKKLATFNMDISHLVPNIPGPCFASDIVKTGNVTISTGDHIFISIKPIGTDDDNTIIWVNNGNISIKITRAGSRPKTDPGPGEEGEPPFTVDTTTPSFTYATAYNVRTRVIVENSASIARYGRVEKFIDIGWTKDFKIVKDILSVMLGYMSKPPMIFNTENVTISAPLVEPGQSVRVVDPIAGLHEGIRQKAIVTNTSIDYDAYGDTGFGSWFYEVGLQGLYDFKSVESPVYAQNPRLACRPIIT